MPHAISIRSDNSSADSIRALWAKCSKLEQVPSMEPQAYPPHITFAIYEQVPMQALFSGLSAAVAQLEQTTITFDSLNYFETPSSFVIWAVPNTPERFLAAHNSIHAQIDSTLCHEHYRPENWVPHCSLATAISMDKKAEVLSLVAQPMEPIEVVFDTVDCVSFLPVNVLKEFSL